MNISHVGKDMGFYLDNSIDLIVIGRVGYSLAELIQSL